MFLVSFGNTFVHSLRSMMTIGTFIRSVDSECLSPGPQRKHVRKGDEQQSVCVSVMQVTCPRPPCASLQPTSCPPPSSTFLHILTFPPPPRYFLPSIPRSSLTPPPQVFPQFPTYSNHSSHSKSDPCFQEDFQLDSNQPYRLDLLEVPIGHFSEQSCLLFLPAMATFGDERMALP